MAITNLPTVDACTLLGREKHIVVANFERALLRDSNPFPYLALVAFDVGGIIRLLFLLLASPFSILLSYLISESAGFELLIFVAFVGVKVSDIDSAARGVLPKFYSTDLHPESWRVFSACGKRCVVTATPRIMVEPFLKDYLGVDKVFGTEIATYRGRATGLVCQPGTLTGKHKEKALLKAFGAIRPDIGLGHFPTDFPLMALCKERYIVPAAKPEDKSVPSDKLPKPIIFHDGRLVQKPTPFVALLTILWFPIGFLLACLRITAGVFLPMSILYYVSHAFGVRVKVKGNPPPLFDKYSCYFSGVLFICSHRSLLDPVFLSIALGRPITAVTYSLSKVSEFISPIKTVRLTRDKSTDASIIKKLLQQGDLAICPEGTTCREPFLLRFSALFAELTDQLVPVAIATHTSMFHGTTARGWKALDSFYFFMNPSPCYEITFLDKLPMELSCSSGKSSHEVANHVQRLIGGALFYQCTNLTRKDKYSALTGYDGSVVEEPKIQACKAMGC